MTSRPTASRSSRTPSEPGSQHPAETSPPARTGAAESEDRTGDHRPAGTLLRQVVAERPYAGAHGEELTLIRPPAPRPPRPPRPSGTGSAGPSRSLTARRPAADPATGNPVAVRVAGH
ncbi:hypothetical protein SAMN05421870_116120 [Streptomyces qinglanensis]|uniref:Uncharacterized protein n=1 Tax=Streptomyces qinglanensis TaxID=943816 RepID=A0A1H9WBK9_9ACTN|nr:hypothetical protein SAMN05421870_116120 [Streptomyces qinglanensis]